MGRSSASTGLDPAAVRSTRTTRVEGPTDRTTRLLADLLADLVLLLIENLLLLLGDVATVL